MLIDIILGTIVSWLGYRYDSRRWVNGFIRKISYLTIVIAVDVISSVIMTDGSLFRTGVSLGFIFYEFSSILEHAVILGVKFPKSLTKFIDHLAVSSGEKEEPDDEEKKQAPPK